MQIILIYWFNFLIKLSCCFSFNSRSAVVRGHVVTSMGMGLMGVRVSTTTPLEGFTLTREDGWFDLLVNGGGAVTLQFGRSPFRPQNYIVNVPWNEVRIFVLENIIMSSNISDCKTYFILHEKFKKWGRYLQPMRD